MTRREPGVKQDPRSRRGGETGSCPQALQTSSNCPLPGGGQRRPGPPPGPPPPRRAALSCTVRESGYRHGDLGRQGGLLPAGQSVLVHGHHPLHRLLHVGCLLASEYPLSEPGSPGLLHSVLGGPPSDPHAQWVLACLADSCGRVLVCHGIMQV